MLCVYGNYNLFNYFSAGIDFNKGQYLTSTDVDSDVAHLRFFINSRNACADTVIGAFNTFSLLWLSDLQAQTENYEVNMKFHFQAYQYFPHILSCKIASLMPNKFKLIKNVKIYWNTSIAH